MSKKKKEEEMIRKSFVIVLLAMVLTIGAVGSASAEMMGIMNLISPATSDLYWDDTNKMLTIGGNISETKLTIVDTSTSPARGMMTAEHSDTNAGALIVGRRSRGTEGSPVAVTPGDFLGAFNTQGYDGSSYQAPTSLASVVDGSVSIGSIPASLVFNVGTATANKPERMRITSSGNVGIGTTAPTQSLEVNGGMRMNTVATKPTCDANARGTFWFIQGSSKDNIEVCVMNGSYMWIQLF